MPRPRWPPRTNDCVFQIDNVERKGAVIETPSGTNYFAGGNVRLSCRGTQITMQSDSVAAYGGNVVHFIGNVKYRDSTLTMDADNGTYFKNGEKWEARGRVRTNNLKNGSTLTGPALDYYRAVKVSGIPWRCSPPAARGFNTPPRTPAAGGPSPTSSSRTGYASREATGCGPAGR